MTFKHSVSMRVEGDSLSPQELAGGRSLLSPNTCSPKVPFNRQSYGASAFLLRGAFWLQAQGWGEEEFCSLECSVQSISFSERRMVTELTRRLGEMGKKYLIFPGWALEVLGA